MDSPIPVANRTTLVDSLLRIIAASFGIWHLRLNKFLSRRLLAPGNGRVPMFTFFYLPRDWMNSPRESRGLVRWILRGYAQLVPLTRSPVGRCTAVGDLAPGY